VLQRSRLRDLANIFTEEGYPLNVMDQEKEGKMSIKKIHKLFSIVGMLLLAMVLYVPSASATTIISYKIGAGPVTTCAPMPGGGPVICPAFSLGGVSVAALSAFSNTPGTPTLAQELGTTLFISSLASTPTTTVDVWIASDGFMNPTAPPTLVYGSSLSFTSTSGSGSVALTSCIDTDLAPLAVPSLGTFCSPGTALTNVPQTYSGVDSDSNTVTMTLASLAAPYTLSEHFTVTIDAGSNLNVNTSTSLVRAPEPTSLALLGSALGLVALVRRKLTASKG